MKKDEGILFEVILKEVAVIDSKPIIDKELSVRDGAQLEFFKTTKLRPAHYMALERIAFHIDKNGWCHPNEDTIAAQLGMTRISIGTFISEVEKKTFKGKPLLLVDRGTYQGKKKNTYTVPVAKLKYIPYDVVLEQETDDYSKDGLDDEVVPVIIQADVKTLYKQIDGALMPFFYCYCNILMSIPKIKDCQNYLVPGFIGGRMIDAFKQ